MKKLHWFTKLCWILAAVLMLWAMSREPEPETPAERRESYQIILKSDCKDLHSKAIGAMSTDDLSKIQECKLAGLW